MKQLQKGFIIPIVLIIIAALAIGGGVYYKQKIKIKNEDSKEIPQRSEDKKEMADETKVMPIKKTVLSFEAKARAAAQAGECGEWGTIGAVTKMDEGSQYAVFTIDNSLIPTTRNSCVVDFYAGTVEAPIVITSENIAGPRKTESASIQAARTIAEKGTCSKEGKVTSFDGYMNIYGGGKATIFRVSSFTDQSQIGLCTVNIEKNTSQFSPPLR